MFLPGDPRASPDDPAPLSALLSGQQLDGSCTMLMPGPQCGACFSLKSWASPGTGRTLDLQGCGRGGGRRPPSMMRSRPLPHGLPLRGPGRTGRGWVLPRPLGVRRRPLPWAGKVTLREKPRAPHGPSPASWPRLASVHPRGLFSGKEPHLRVREKAKHPLLSSFRLEGIQVTRGETQRQAHGVGVTHGMLGKYS
ncbi:uncharacterized protein LOC144298680 [Canis aureus]